MARGCETELTEAGQKDVPGLVFLRRPEAVFAIGAALTRRA